jgi:NAD(P)-dependent dehydrogenase (short-subunit alcohol dehydrogenase family)
LINNAGSRASSHRKDGQAGPVNSAWLETPWSDWLWTFEQNVGAAVRLSQGFVPGMRRRGWGCVINIASAAATQTEPDLADYQAAKAAMVNITSSLATTLAHTGITVSTISPGTLITPSAKSTFHAWAEQLGWSDDWNEIERRFIYEEIRSPRRLSEHGRHRPRRRRPHRRGDPKCREPAQHDLLRAGRRTSLGRPAPLGNQGSAGAPCCMTKAGSFGTHHFGGDRADGRAAEPSWVE